MSVVVFDPSQQSENLKFAFEASVKEDLKRRLQLNGEDKELCKFFSIGKCKDGDRCQFRHAREKSVVCKHWLRGLCKKADSCEFLHEYDLSKMPPCQFIATYGECSKGNECPFLHITPEDLIRDCPWYARGFCKHGPNCRNRHTRKEACANYLAGFCPLGPNCSNGHPKYELPTENVAITRLCSRCGQMGHTVENCRSDPVRYDEVEPPPEFGRAALHNNRPQLHQRNDSARFRNRTFQDRANYNNNNNNNNNNNDNRDQHQFSQYNNQRQQFHRRGNNNRNNNSHGSSRPLSEVTCFKCGQMGHYANKCMNRRVPAPNGGYNRQIV